MQKTDAIHREPPAWLSALLGQVSRSFEVAGPEDILEWAAETFGGGLTLGTSFGASGMALIDLASRVCPDLEVFYIDTGLFFPETYELIERAEERYQRSFTRITPELTVREQAEEHGAQLWEREPNHCCYMRKVLPMRRALEGQEAWMTALRRDQSPTRANTPIITWNEKFQVVKIAPLANWTRKDLWSYLVRREVPYNELHDRGYPSIGCTPCTSPVDDHEDARSGRWRGKKKTECGLHL